MKKVLLGAILLFLAFGKLSAQTQYQNSGWFFFLNNTKFNDRWGLQLDVQVRSADDWAYVRNTLFRPGITYYINTNNNVTAGYLLSTTLNSTEDAAKNILNEHRIWEQYILTHKIKSVFSSHRIRLEQRFIERANDDVFSQRFRYFFRFIKPLKKAEASFTNGFFVALQNEVFLNLQNKEKINNDFFDQNRLYMAAGYRFSKQIDLEAGYLNQAIHGVSNNTINHIIQLAVYTRF